jgi:[acyl-carrier-protein] S-malonyltransferase
MIAVVFPGQGSQAPGMGRELCEANPVACDVFDRVGYSVGIDMRKLCFDSDVETLRQTENAQLALYTCGVAAHLCFEAALGSNSGKWITAFAGHSVGEYAALAAADIFSVEEGARLVRTRGAVMARAGRERPGTMAAVLGLGREELQKACDEAGGIVVIANDNCPGQLVISGEVSAVERAGELAKIAGAKRVLPLNVSGAFHSPLMEEPSREMAVALNQVMIGAGTTPVYSNVTAEPVSDVAHWPSLLERQLKSPVRWTETIEHLRRDGALLFVECGWGDVLSGLIRRTDKEARVAKVADPESLLAAVSSIDDLMAV